MIGTDKKTIKKSRILEKNERMKKEGRRNRSKEFLKK
jgi:hypothetical protein